VVVVTFWILKLADYPVDKQASAEIDKKENRW
jgi:hypothetical protein